MWVSVCLHLDPSGFIRSDAFISLGLLRHTCPPGGPMLGARGSLTKAAFTGCASLRISYLSYLSLEKDAVTAFFPEKAIICAVSKIQV